MATIQVEMPDEMFVAARRSPAEVASEMRLALAAYWYAAGVVSQGMAAQIAGLSRADLMRSLSHLGVSPFQETLADVRAILHDV